MREQLAAEVTKLNANRRRKAQRLVDAASNRLMNAGWRARGEVRIGVPADSLVAAARAARADLLVVGARGTGGMARLLLGSVADAVSK
jgi:nucleotide-binding universal stress UspA family protein